MSPLAQTVDNRRLAVQRGFTFGEWTAAESPGDNVEVFIDHRQIMLHGKQCGWIKRISEDLTTPHYQLSLTNQLGHSAAWSRTYPNMGGVYGALLNAYTRGDFAHIPALAVPQPTMLTLNSSRHY